MGHTTEVPRYIPAKAFAEAAHLSDSTLRRWRSEGKGPRATRVGRRWKYRADEVAAFLEGSTD